MKNTRIKSFAITICIFVSIGLFAQDKPEQEYHETKQDAYMPMLESEKKTSPAYYYASPQITTRQVNVDANGRNILSDAANEPSIAIDPKNPNRMAMGWRQFDNVLSNFRQAGIGVSEDNGMTWKKLMPLDAGVFRSDPVLCADNRGNFYYNALAGNFTCDVYKTNNLDKWVNRTYAYGGDKQWMTVDNTNQTSDGNLYVYWNHDYSSCTDYNFTRSTDKANSFENCSVIPTYLTRGTVTVAPDGSLYAAGSRFGQFYINRSVNAKVPGLDVEWDLSNVVDLLGYLPSYYEPNPGGLLGQVWIASDHSLKSSRGNLYLLSTVFRQDIGDYADIMFSKSEDRGETWSAPIAINKDQTNSNYQWFGTMSVAPNGRIDVIWLDTRDHPGTYLSSLYYSYSNDAGQHWTPDQKLSDSFDPQIGYPNQNKIGDYLHMISDNDGAHLAWAATFNGEQDVYYSYIKPDTITTNTNEVSSKNSLYIYPNPITANSTIQFTSSENQQIKIIIYNSFGNKLSSVTREASNGNNKINMNEMLTTFPSGIYSLQIQNKQGSQLASNKFVVK